MHYKYVHLSGGESMKDLLKLKGIVKDDKQSVNILRPKICPNCNEPNKPDAQFCFKCHFIISFEAHQRNMEERERKDREILELKERMDKMDHVILKLGSNMEFYRKEFELYREQFGNCPLTEGDRKKIREAKEQINALPGDVEDA